MLNPHGASSLPLASYVCGGAFLRSHLACRAPAFRARVASNAPINARRATADERCIVAPATLATLRNANGGQAGTRTGVKCQQCLSTA